MFQRGSYAIYWIVEERKLVNSLMRVKLERIIDSENYCGKNGDILVLPCHMSQPMVEMIGIEVNYSPARDVREKNLAAGDCADTTA